jgi:hypothetical protein
MRNGSTIVYNSDNAVTLNLSLADSNRGYRIQLIRKRWYKTAEEVINSFDFTVCQILTDGDRILFGPTSAEDVKNKLVRHNALKPIQDDVIKRIIKYVCYGYNLDRELSEYIRNNKDTLTWRFNSDQDHYENAF